jgi:hypothetical protein
MSQGCCRDTAPTSLADCEAERDQITAGCGEFQPIELTLAPPAQATGEADGCCGRGGDCTE